jgi:two-component system, chemotaxis family, sensor kinase Cph1
MQEVVQEPLPYGHAIDTSNCDREPIHIPGHIQAHGVLLVLHPGELTLLQVSDNVRAYLGQPVEALLGQPVEGVLGSEQVAWLRQCLQAERLEGNPLHLFTASLGERGDFHVIAHLHEGLLLLELEPVQTRSTRPPDFYTLVKGSVTRFQSAGTVREFCQVVTEEVRRVSGYDRVMVYRFSEDWSGHVIAEDMAPDKGLAPFLELHYPASDIPAQARALFLLNTVRMLPDARYVPARLLPEFNPLTGRPLDMSHAFLRGASQMYTEYLTNMGVRASLTLAITQGSKLWGLVACHHYTPRQVSYDVRTACELLARVVSLQVADKQAREEADYRQRIHEVHERLVRCLARYGELAQGVSDCAPHIRQFMDCGGVAVLSREFCLLLGDTPTQEQIRELVEWLKRSLQEEEEVFVTDALPSRYAPAEGFKAVASGLLALPVSRVTGDYVLWFRPEVPRTVTWAGDPHKPVEVGPMGDRLTPRKSFALWKETVRGRSLPWRSLEVEAARSLRVALIDVVLRRNEELARVNEELARVNEELRRSNAELDSFAYVASHDLKEPLRGIYNFSSFMLEDYEAKLDEEGQRKLRTVIRLTRRMQALIDSLLHFSRLGREPLNPELLDLNEVVAESLELVDVRLREAGSRVSIPRPLPRVRADRVGLLEVYVNLISNALKYNDKLAREVELGVLYAGEPGFPPRAEDRALCLYVRDNGIGIPEVHVENVFQLFKRLHAQSEYGGGTGAGLTIVKRVLERHGGRVWLSSVEGQGTTFFFVLGKE